MISGDFTQVGSEVPIGVTIEAPEAGLTADDMEFTCEFFTSPGTTKYTVTKSQMTKESETVYSVIVKTEGMSAGEILLHAIVNVPDTRSNTGSRKEEHLTGTGVVIYDFK